MARLHRSLLHLAFLSYYINVDERTTRENTHRCNKVWSQVSYSKSNQKNQQQIKIDHIYMCTYLPVVIIVIPVALEVELLWIYW